MLVLIFPAMGICIGLMVMSYKRRYLLGEQPNSKRKSDRRSESGPGPSVYPVYPVVNAFCRHLIRVSLVTAVY